MSTETLLLAGKPGTGKLAPGKVTPLKGVKAKPELTQQLVVKQAPPPTPDIPHWKGDFPFPKDIVYTDKPDGKLIADLRMTVEKSGIERPSRGKWGAVRAQWGKADVPLLDKVVVVETEEGYKITNAIFLLKIEFGIINYNSPAWESAWDSGMEKLTGRYGITPEERKYWAFQHEMDHFRAWSEYFRFVLKHVFSALNTGFESKKWAYRDISGLAWENRVEIQASQMEQDVSFEGLIVAVASRFHPHRLDACIETLGVGIGLLEPKHVQDSIPAADHQLGHLLHGFQV